MLDPEDKQERKVHSLTVMSVCVKLRAGDLCWLDLLTSLTYLGKGSFN